jgi:hypothetical protein
VPTRPVWGAGDATRVGPLGRGLAGSGGLLASTATAGALDDGSSEARTGSTPCAHVGTGTAWRMEAATTSEGRKGRRSATSAVTKVTAQHAMVVADVVTKIHVTASTARRFTRAVIGPEH